MKFSKMHGAGNDFIIINLLDNNILNLNTLAEKMCDRHFGVGADGLMAVKKSESCDVQMLYFNSDGSRAALCGNGIRCFSKYVYEKNIAQKNPLTVETLAGNKTIQFDIKEGLVDNIIVNMGSWSFDPGSIPAVCSKEKLLLEKVEIDGKLVEISSLLMGVPHTVIFVEDIEKADIETLGPKIENLAMFPQKTNVNFVQIIDQEHILVDTWERGAGKTLACGTGACASVIVSHLLGYIGDSVQVKVPGGVLRIQIIEGEQIIMEGKAEFICDGEFYNS
ncbi:MAG: diaminopimelate epimerase [Bacillota bacterium]